MQFKTLADQQLVDHDIVQLNNGDQLIITEIIPNRPANPYVGIKVKGNGAQYKFGYKHRPVKIGHAESTHPALVALAARRGTNQNTLVEQLRAAARRYIDAVVSNDRVRMVVLQQELADLGV